MGFVKTAEEIAKIQAVLAASRFVNFENVVVDFLTTPETVANCLPPGLEPVDEPRVKALVGRWQSNCVGDFYGGAIYLAAKHGDLEGDYVLAMYMDRDQPIIYGRELFGEPKKQATSLMHRNGDCYAGFVDRHGTRLIELAVNASNDAGASRGPGVNFNYKATPSITGAGVEFDRALLTVAEFDMNIKVHRTGEGKVRLGGTPHDPLSDIEVVSILGGAYLEGDLYTTARPLLEVSGEAFLPYLHGRNDDWSLLNTEVSAFRAPSDAIRQPNSRKDREAQ